MAEEVKKTKEAKKEPAPKITVCPWVVAISKRIDQINIEIETTTNPLHKCELENAKFWLKCVLEDMKVSKEERLLADILG